VTGKDLRPPVEWAAVQSFYDEPLFDEARVRELLVSAALPDKSADKLPAITFALNELAKGFAFDRWNEAQPSSSKEEIRAQRLALACLSILEIVGSGGEEPTPENILPMFGSGGLYGTAALRGEPSGKAAVLNALRGVWLLRQDAGKLVEITRKRQRMDPPKAGRPEGKSIKRLLTGLSALYFEVWGKAPTVIRAKASSQKAGRSTLIGGESVGPFVSFIVGVTTAIQHKLGGPRTFYFTADSLAKAWERLDEDEEDEDLVFPMDEIGKRPA
jgi:hypothetical protein